MDYTNQYEVKAEMPTDRGYRFTQITGKNKGRKIWIDKEKHSLNIVVGKEYIISTNRDLDSDKIKNSEYIKLEKFSISESSLENNKIENNSNKCSDCQTHFKIKQEYWELKREGKVIMNSCVDCWNKHTFSKKNWEG